MKLEIDIPKHQYNNIMALDSINLGRAPYKGIIMYAINAIKRGKALKQEPMVEIDLYSVIKQKYIECEVLDKIRAEILDCLKALDEIEKSGLNIYLPNEMSGRRLTYQQCLEFIDKYKAESEE